MTPAINQVKKAKIEFCLHEYDHDPNVRAFGKEASEKLGIPADQIFKTLVVSAETQGLAIAVVPVSGHLDLKTFANVIGAKKAEMAEKKQVIRSTGYVTGGVSPIGQKKQLPTIIDTSALNFNTIFVSAGRRGLQIALSPENLAVLTNAVFHGISK